MGVNLYLMHCDLEDLRENWRSKQYMTPFVQTYPVTVEYKIDEMVGDFFILVEHRMKKIFNTMEKSSLTICVRRRCTPLSLVGF